MTAAIIAALILMSPSLVSAECAWVLWSGKWGKDWVIHGTHTDKQACLRRLQTDFASRRLTETEVAAGNAQLGPRRGSDAMNRRRRRAIKRERWRRRRATKAEKAETRVNMYKLERLVNGDDDPRGPKGSAR